MEDIEKMREKLQREIEKADLHTLEIISDFLAFGDEDPLEQLGEAAQQSLQRGTRDADEGKLTPHDVVMKKYKE